MVFFLISILFLVVLSRLQDVKAIEQINEGERVMYTFSFLPTSYQRLRTRSFHVYKQNQTLASSD